MYVLLGLESLLARRWYWKLFFLQNHTQTFSSLPNSLHNRDATTLNHQVKDILKNQTAEPIFSSHHFFLAPLKFGKVLILTCRI